MNKKKKMIIITLITIIGGGIVIGYKWYQKKKTKYVTLGRRTTPECLNPRNCPACPYYTECYGMEVDI